MVFIDIVLIVIIAAFVFFGLFFGLIHTLGSLIGTVIGILFASRLVDPAFESFGFIFGGGAISKVIIFVIIFFIIARLVGIGFWFVEKIFDFITMIPFAKSLDKFLGGLFGFVEGIVIVGVVLFYAMQILPEDTLRTMLEGSVVASYLVETMGAFRILFPEAALKAVEQAADSAAESLPDTSAVDQAVEAAKDAVVE